MLKTSFDHITARISQSLQVHITATKPDARLDLPTYALNWFDTRSLCLYNTYNFLAASSVLSIKGLPFFKARVNQVLQGSDESRRDVLLIVRYPSAHAFKRMLESRYFQVVSVLRIVAVKHFTFAFSQRKDIDDQQQGLTAEDNQRIRIKPAKSYVVHHFQSDMP